MKREMLVATVLIVVLLSLFSVPVQADTIVEIAIADPANFSTLVAAVIAADLVDTLNGTDEFTVFAPTDGAFAALPPGVLDYLLSDTAALTEVLLYHVVAGEANSTDLSDGDMLETVQGNNLTVAIDGTVMINDATVIIPDVDADNGVIHVIDKVLVPEGMLDIVDTAINAGIFNTLVTALEVTGLNATLRGEGPFTVFAPTDDAFAAVHPDTLAFLLDNTDKLSEILLYHVVAGEYMSGDVVAADSLMTVQGSPVNIMTNDGVMIDGAEIIVVDIVCSNGVIHVIDAVMIPPPPFVIPELALGTILAVLAMLAALIGYVSIKRYRK